MAEPSTFIIVEEGRPFAPVRIRSKELLVGSARQCGLRLNDSSIPLAVAGIKKIEGCFYFLPLGFSPFSDAKRTSISLNGRELMGDAALAAGDVIGIGGCRLLVNNDADTLVIRLSYPDREMATELSAAMASGRPSVKGGDAETLPVQRPGSRAAHDVLGQWIKRRLWKGRQKVPRQTHLQPNPPKRQAGTEFNWSPTRDLVPPWPAAFLALCLVVVLAGALLAFVLWPSIYAPGRISSAHSRSQLSLTPAIASNAISGSCLNCHTWKVTVDQNCARCHQADGFHASITKAHESAGITCTDCHVEHRGPDFSPKAAAFDSCVACHNDNNKQTYNGKTVHTPHGGTLGYPTSAGKWIWSGLDEEALKLKPEVSETWKSEYDEQSWLKVQFHAIHLYRVKAAPGITGIEDGTLSCSSCHLNFGGKFDRETPRQTCDNCHNGFLERRTSRSFIAADKPNCTSCHVQHYYDSHRWGELLTESAHDNRRRAIDKTYVESVRQSALPR
jgi:hypothetical protein